MNQHIGDWIGKNVHVTLRATIPTSLQGTLANADDSGILLDMAKGRVFIPTTSILHISLAEGS